VFKELNTAGTLIQCLLTELLAHRGQTTGPFFSGKGSRLLERACPIRFMKSSRVPMTTAGLQPMPSSRRISLSFRNSPKTTVPNRVSRQAEQTDSAPR